MYYPNYSNFYKQKNRKNSDYLQKLINNLSIVLIIFIVFLGLKFIKTDNAIKLNEYIKSNIEKDYTSTIKSYAISKLSKINIKSINVFSNNDFMLEFLPVDGKVIVKFGDKLNSADDSSVSKGIIIQTDKTSDVKNVFDGYVEKIENNDKLGLILTIDHHNGYKSIYGNLGEIRFVEGEKVEKEDVIGINSLDPVSKKYNLYYELIQSNASVDPLKFYKTN
ncbi:AmiB activator [Caloramator mitchellensis]|uniref:AmiB activator n=1 Tax=Caloramator mitchellensis TaxID=908809 RepID=A0A0R3K4U2_CALMK|nr:peptidoglycan DD-metalloendopeptidase family protein [Caloramator mitchellensis]KRQ88149.1 AmiB activator [Caloramator mitchellensis]